MIFDVKGTNTTNPSLVDIWACLSIPICSMYGIFTNIYPINGPNVGKYTSTMEHMGDISNKNQYL